MFFLLKNYHPQQYLAKSGYNPDKKFLKINQPSIFYGYTLKTKYANFKF